MPEINDMKSFQAWYSPLKTKLGDKLTSAMNDLITTVNKEFEANPMTFFTDDKKIPNGKDVGLQPNTAKNVVRWHLVNQWVPKLELLDGGQAEVAVAEPQVDDITALAETEVVEDIGESGDFDETHDEATKRQAQEVNIEPDLGKTQECDPSDYLGPHAEPKLSQPTTTSDALARLGTALHDFVASTESPPEDKAEVDLTEVIERIEKLEKRFKSLFNSMRDI